MPLPLLPIVGGAAALVGLKMLKGLVSKAFTPAPFTETPFGPGGGMGMGMYGYGGMGMGGFGGSGFMPGGMYTNYSQFSPFGRDIWSKVGPFNIQMRNPLDAMAQKFTQGLYSHYANKYSQKYGAMGGVMGGGMGMPTMGAGWMGMGGGMFPVGGGFANMPALGARMPFYGGMTPFMGMGMGMGGIMGSGPMAAPANALHMVDRGDMAEQMVGAAMPQLASLNMEIDGMLSKIRAGGKLTQEQMLILQDLMDRRKLLFETMSQIMRSEHETKKGMIGRIG